MATTRKKSTRSSKPRTASAPSDDRSGMAVASKIKAYLAKKGLRSEGALADAVSRHISYILDNGAARARAAGRQTVKAVDL